LARPDITKLAVRAHFAGMFRLPGEKAPVPDSITTLVLVQRWRAPFGTPNPKRFESTRISRIELGFPIERPSIAASCCASGTRRALRIEIAVPKLTVATDSLSNAFAVFKRGAGYCMWQFLKEKRIFFVSEGP